MHVAFPTKDKVGFSEKLCTITRIMNPLSFSPTSSSEAVTHGIRVQVQASYAAERSHPAASIYVFLYTIVISNEGTEQAQLKSRQWLITDANQNVQEVQGPGVVGETPLILPQQSFSYSSGCILHVPFGMMQGTYQMTRANGEAFDVEIAPFLLTMPHGVN